MFFFIAKKNHNQSKNIQQNQETGSSWAQDLQQSMQTSEKPMYIIIDVFLMGLFVFWMLIKGQYRRFCVFSSCSKVAHGNIWLIILPTIAFVKFGFELLFMIGLTKLYLVYVLIFAISWSCFGFILGQRNMSLVVPHIRYLAEQQQTFVKRKYVSLYGICFTVFLNFSKLMTLLFFFIYLSPVWLFMIKIIHNIWIAMFVIILCPLVLAILSMSLVKHIFFGKPHNIEIFSQFETTGDVMIYLKQQMNYKLQGVAIQESGTMDESLD